MSSDTSVSLLSGGGPLNGHRGSLTVPSVRAQGMTVVILRITREGWRTVRGHPNHHRARERSSSRKLSSWRVSTLGVSTRYHAQPPHEADQPHS